jgi:hypothetical protein
MAGFRNKLMKLIQTLLINNVYDNSQNNIIMNGNGYTTSNGNPTSGNGSNNISVGRNTGALFNNNNNIAFGTSALTNNSSSYQASQAYVPGQKYNDANNMIAIGNLAATSMILGGYNDIAIGVNALGAGGPHSYPDGSNNIALGSYALYTNNRGFDNIAIGSNALFGNTNGTNNIALGNGALQNNTNYVANNSGHKNIALGTNALNSNTDGSSNIAIGNNALNNNLNGSGNIGIGINAGTGVSSTVGDINCNNIAIGSNSLTSFGNNNTFIGVNCNLDLQQNKLGSNDGNIIIGTGDGISRMSFNGFTKCWNFSCAPPQHHDSPGKLGDFSYDSNYIYIYCYTNVNADNFAIRWKRIPLAVWT